jgi:hypothetical protein
MAFFTSESKEPNLQTQWKQHTERLAQLNPLVEKIYANSAIHFFGKGMDYLIEFGFYIIGIACIGFVFIMNTIFPFHILGEIISKQMFRQNITNSGDLDTFHFAVKGLVALIGILFIIMGMFKNSSRKKKELLQQAGKILKEHQTYFTLQKKDLEIQLPKTDLTNNAHLTKLEATPFPKTLQ